MRLLHKLALVAALCGGFFTAADSQTYNPQPTTVVGNSTTTAPVAGTFCRSLTATGNGADTTEDTLLTCTLPANAFDAVGRCIEIKAWGTMANNADNKTAKLYFGVLTYTSTTSTFTNFSWYIWSTVCKTGSNTQTSAATGIFQNTVPSTGVATPNQTDTNPIIIKVTGQAGTANANDIVAAGMTVMMLN